MTFRRENIKLLLISMSLCISVAITQHVSCETTNANSIPGTKTGCSQKKPLLRNNLHGRKGRGLTWDPCQQDSDCLRPRTCRKLLKNGNSRACNSRPDCLCDITIDLASTCIEDSECHPGEFCYLPFKDAVGNCFSKRASQFKYLRPRKKRRRSKRRPSRKPAAQDDDRDDRDRVENTVTPSPSSQGLRSESEADNVTSHENKPEGGKYCIGMNSLVHMSRADLKFEKDIKAKVLCDEFNSCATSGHVVIVNGRGLMMSSYCKEIKCYETVMLVNSPKETKYVRVKSKTEGVVFTGFSARYGTKVEEMLFRMLTSLGL